MKIKLRKKANALYAPLVWKCSTPLQFWAGQWSLSFEKTLQRQLNSICSPPRSRGWGLSAALADRPHSGLSRTELFFLVFGAANPPPHRSHAFREGGFPQQRLILQHRCYPSLTPPSEIILCTRICFFLQKALENVLLDQNGLLLMCYPKLQIMCSYFILLFFICSIFVPPVGTIDNS